MILKSIVLAIAISSPFFVLIYMLNFEHLSAYGYFVKFVLIVLGVGDLALVLMWKKSQEHPPFIAFISAGIVIFGIIIFLSDYQLTRLQPIASGWARLHLNIEPTKIDKSKLEATTPSDISLYSKERIMSFMQIIPSRTMTWGNDGLASEIDAEYSMNRFSYGYGEPFDFYKKWDAIMLHILMLPSGSVVTGGKLVLTFNGIKNRELQIPPQTSLLTGLIFCFPKKITEDLRKRINKDFEALATKPSLKDIEENQ